ncbi:hypothetical protein CHLRE_01g050700v5 [Chlamydomonas reinhardtii]|uniref:Uncharacterized protein n=1 Tax=Chlamydomonas reinhardtii TaxID=3055 RepID=A0A2K3E822_CHLRE|nr:uncharacterized protein CHLRE_01g050700v5 [Chlamydomonas reinhardtii]PNW88922.1 hypothetical protein CHLRE_01g050700v5 [Chlamydomonas reinhardtii]
MPPKDPEERVPYTAVLSDKYVQKKLASLGQYLLGEHNPSRRIRDISGVLPMYVELGVSCWAYWVFLIKVLLVAFNVTAIFCAFLTYKAPATKDWQYTEPSQVVAWLEFLGICWYLLWFLWRCLKVVWACFQEWRSPHDQVYVRNLAVSSAVRLWYKAGLKLDFNLLMFIRYISPPAVALALQKARKRVYGTFGTRVHRQNCCVDCMCCCCFYSRLALCSLVQTVAVVLFAGVALMAVLIKVLQLRFLGQVPIDHWSITELLLFGQFVVNMACLDTRQKSKRKGKLELLFDGADAEEAVGERKAKSLVDNLALLVLRYRYSLLTALVAYHSLTADDISYVYIEDLVEASKPRNRVRHEYKTRAKPQGPSGGGAAKGRRQAAEAADSMTYDNPGYNAGYPGYPGYTEMAGMGAAAAAGASAGNALYPGQVLVQISPRRRPAQETPPSVQEPPTAADGRGAQGPLGRFPQDFYTHGYAVGAPVHGYNPQEVLKTKYEQQLWGVQAS